MDEQQQAQLPAALARQQLALLSVAAWLSSYSKNSDVARNRMFYELMLDYAQRCIKGAGFEPAQDQQALFDQARELEAQIREQTTTADAEGYKLYWASWYSPTYDFSEYEDKYETPPFQFWITGQELGNNVHGEPIFTMCALVRAPSARLVESAVLRYFTTVVMRFCTAVSGDVVLSDRFVGFENRTALTW